MSKIASLGLDGTLKTAGDFIEYPPELEGTRNLFSSKLYSTEEKSSLYDFDEFNNLIIKGVDDRGSTQSSYNYFIEVEPETEYVMTFSEPMNDRFYSYSSTGALSSVSKTWPDNKTMLIKTSKDTVKLTGKFYPINQTYPKNVKIKIEKGGTPTAWTPAPEDLDLVYPDWVQNFTTSFNENGMIGKSLIEYPEELKGGRNLLIGSGDTTSNSAYSLKSLKFANSPLIKGKMYTVTMKYTVGEDRTSLSIYSSGGYASLCSFKESDKNNKGTASKSFIMNYAIGKEPIDGFDYVTVYQMASSGKSSSTLEWIKIEEGGNATQWTPAPEDLGLVYPDSIQTFGISLNGQRSVIKNVIEHPPILSGGRNLIPNSDKPSDRGGSPITISKELTPEGYLKIVAENPNGNYYSSMFSSTIMNEVLKEGDTITVSVEVKSPDSTKGPTLYINNLTSYMQLEGVVSSEFSVIKYTRTWRAGTGAMHFGFASSPGTFYFKSIKIEKGSEATPWTPAPEDLGLVYPQEIQSF